MKKKLRMFLCAALTASMMATAPALVQAAEEKETTETTESNAVRQDLAGLNNRRYRNKTGPCRAEI
mgnify:CR=1 FL=1